MKNYLKLHVSLINLGAIQSVVGGFLLIIKPDLVISTFLKPRAAATLDMTKISPSFDVLHALFSTIGVLLIFYGSVMAALAVTFDRRSLRIKAFGELFSALHLVWIAWVYFSLLEPWLALLAFQHLLVGIIYFATAKHARLQIGCSAT